MQDEKIPARAFSPTLVFPSHLQMYLRKHAIHARVLLFGSSSFEKTSNDSSSLQHLIASSL